MAGNIPPPLIELLNKVDPGFITFAYMLPTRIIRVVASTNFKTFRVEQLVRTNRDNMKPQGTWRTCSTHGGEMAGAALSDAMNAAREAQVRLVGKFKARRKGIIHP